MEKIKKAQNGKENKEGKMKGREAEVVLSASEAGLEREEELEELCKKAMTRTMARQYKGIPFLHLNGVCETVYWGFRGEAKVVEVWDAGLEKPTFYQVDVEERNGWVHQRWPGHFSANGSCGCPSQKGNYFGEKEARNGKGH